MKNRKETGAYMAQMKNAKASPPRGASGSDPLLSGDPDRALLEMMGIIERLSGVIASETEAVRNADTKTFMRLQEDKMAAAHLYQAGVGQIVARREEMKKASPALRARLEKMRADFAELTRTNQEELERMRRSVQRLGERMMTLARRAARDKTAVSYNAAGSMDATGKRAVSMGIIESA